MKHYGRKVKLDGYTFDSVKEASFYAAYIKNSGKEYAVHPQYECCLFLTPAWYELEQSTIIRTLLYMAQTSP